MAETLISPGVFLQENDLSQITQGPIEAGAALVGPTVTGPVNIPTYVTSYSQYKAVFGASFVSGGNNYEYLTSMAALNYFEQGGDSLLVTRVASGSYTAATASVPSGVISVAGISSTGSIAIGSFTAAQTGSWVGLALVDKDTHEYKYFSAFGAGSGVYNYYSNELDYGYWTPNNGNSWTVDQWTGSLISNWNSTPELSSILTFSSQGGNLHFTGSSSNLVLYYGLYIGQATGSTGLSSSLSVSTPAVTSTVFDLETLSVGSTMNNLGGTVTNGLLPSGSTSNIRWEITSADTGSGLFSLIVRRGDDYENSKTILETWNNLSLDPNQNNYISYIIGDQTQTVQTDEFGNSYLQLSGTYPNNSKYIRVKAVYKPTPNYFNTDGTVNAQYTSSFPQPGSGSYNGTFSSAQGAIWGSFNKAGLNMFESIPTANSVVTQPSTNIQGVHPANYSTAISLLSNQDAYDFNAISVPGLNMQNASSIINDLVEMVESRGDAIAVVDTVAYGQSMTQAKQQAAAYDNSYAATYWPWIQLRSRETGKLNFVPASTLIPAVYEYNDRVAAEWFAPAGLNRGGLSTVIQPERRLSVNDRNYLYAGKVNPIASFPGVGTVIYGQKTLQAKPSALDRVNVRRLLIALKSYIKQVAENLVFEPNTQVTRNRFLNQVNPYLEFVQQKQGLYAFQVVMDETNNTPDVIDRNQLVGSIYLQPTKTAEFIQLDFNILPTGASFGQ
jgi:phage tail sheath protein FI